MPRPAHYRLPDPLAAALAQLFDEDVRHVSRHCRGQAGPGEKRRREFPQRGGVVSRRHGN